MVRVRASRLEPRYHGTGSDENVVFIKMLFVGLGGLGVTFSPRDPRFECSNPADIDRFFSGRKNREHKSSGRDLGLGVPSLRFLAR